MKTFVAKPLELERKWYVVDAAGKNFGRLASEVAKILRGKNKPIFTPYVDTGDYVIIINCEKVVFTGKKLDQKVYKTYSGYQSGLKETSYRHLMEKRPERAFEHAVKGMLPKNSLGRAMFKKLKVYKGPNHDHQAQKPEVLELDT